MPQIEMDYHKTSRFLILTTLACDAVICLGIFLIENSWPWIILAAAIPPGIFLSIQYRLVRIILITLGVISALAFVCIPWMYQQSNQQNQSQIIEAYRQLAKAGSVPAPADPHSIRIVSRHGGLPCFVSVTATTKESFCFLVSRSQYQTSTNSTWTSGGWRFERSAKKAVTKTAKIE